MLNTNVVAVIFVSSLLLVLFVGLKLGHVISWSWWVVLAPLWVPPLALLITFLILLAALIFGDR